MIVLLTGFTGIYASTLEEKFKTEIRHLRLMQETEVLKAANNYIALGQGTMFADLLYVKDGLSDVGNIMKKIIETKNDNTEQQANFVKNNAEKYFVAHYKIGDISHKYKKPRE